jgi:transcription initiation factor TFIIB
MMKSKEVTKCPECRSMNLIRDFEAGELVCEQCGFVISSTILNYGPERRAFDNKQREERTRAGAPMTWTIHDKGLSTNIDWRDLDYYRRRLNPEQRAQMYRLRKWNRRSKASEATDRNLMFALSEITKIVYKLRLPRNVLETASLIYRRAVKERLIRGRSIQGVVTASVYMACRNCNVIRTLEEVGIAGNISKKESGRQYRFLVKELGTRIPAVDPSKYVSRFMNQFALSGNTEIIAMKILELSIKLRLTSGRGPAGIAAAVTYIATRLTDEQRTQSDIAKQAHVTEVTIRNRYKDLIKNINFEIKL